MFIACMINEYVYCRISIFKNVVNYLKIVFKNYTTIIKYTIYYLKEFLIRIKIEIMSKNEFNY